MALGGHRLAIGHLVVHIQRLQLAVGLGQRIDLRTEGMHRTATGAVDKGDGAVGLQRRFEHRQGRGDAHAATDQHQRTLAGLQGEMASRCKQLQGVAHLQIMQVVGDLATGLALDADAVAAAIARGRQRVVAALLAATHDGAQPNVLARLVGDHRLAIGRLQVERADLGTLCHLLHQLEGACTAPAAFGMGNVVIGLGLGGDQDVGQLGIGSGPGVDHRIGGNLGAQYLADGAQQACAHDLVLAGLHLQGHMLVDDLRGQVAQVFQLVDVLGIHQHAVRQRAGLGTALLVGLVEQRAHLRELAQHHLVEMRGQRLAAGLQQRYGGLDDLFLAIGQHLTLLACGWFY